jgi:hypothetical protein
MKRNFQEIYYYYSDAESVPLYFHALLSKNPEMTLSFVEAVLGMRGLSRSEYNMAVEGCKKVEEDTRKKWEANNSKPELGI